LFIQWSFELGCYDGLANRFVCFDWIDFRCCILRKIASEVFSISLEDVMIVEIPFSAGLLFIIGAIVFFIIVKTIIETIF